MFPLPNSNLERTLHIKANKPSKALIPDPVFPLEPLQTSCMICTRSSNQIQYQLLHKFCLNCINKLICHLCIQQITSLPCPFCHTNNKLWRKTKRDVLFSELERKVEQKRRFWNSLKIKQKNIHMQYAIRNGIQQYIHILDGLVQKLTQDIKYLVKLDWDKDPRQNETDVTKEIEEINTMEETYDHMMIDIKNQFGLELNSQ